MTKEEKIDMFSMKLDGKTFQAIGDKYGISKQRVQQVLSSVAIPRVRNLERVVYPNLRDWMLESGMSAKSFAISVLGVKQTSASTLGSRFLFGKQDFRLKDLAKIKEATGLSFEQILDRGDSSAE